MNQFLGLPPEVSAHAHEIDGSISLIHWLMFVLFIGWSAFFLYSLYRFRRKRNPVANYAGMKSNFPFYIVGAIALFEGVLLVGFDLPLWARLVRDIPPESESTVVRAVGEQFAWNFHYPGPDGVFGRVDPSLISPDNPLGIDRTDPAAKDDITTINQLNLPVGKPVVIRLSSKDVIHSFGIPLLRVKQDAVPGQNVRVTFTPIKTSEEVLAEVTRNYRISASTNPDDFNIFQCMMEYKDKDGNVILAKGDGITQDAITKMLAAGFTEVYAGPLSPVEVACSQLCGLGHYRMRASVNIQTPEAYKAWVADQLSQLQQ